ncbi:hypothetical protein CYMTET_8009 [Cymbomonas tetramitiformis]|uniref:Uncharacterized protein n=1 Tax=Cymbomonas tetramitiformis TaxID=36881 RepID=A0AAE0GUG5_9CHLO|nr:hypothetical protein CYMTET_8009 [Cymbomonas tetramitiformis]
MYLHQLESTVIITRSELVNNIAIHGGAIAAFGTSLNLSDSQFIGNNATLGAAVYAGKHLNAEDGDVLVSISDILIVGCILQVELQLRGRRGRRAPVVASF